MILFKQAYQERESMFYRESFQVPKGHKKSSPDKSEELAIF
jgi:hypothetical protein